MSVERFKADAEISVERLKNTLQMAALEHQVRFSNLHEKRAEVLADLYRQLVDADREVRRYVYNRGMRGDETVYQAVANKLFAFSTFFEAHRIYLPEQVCTLLHRFMGELGKPVGNIWVYADIDNPTPETIRDRSIAFKEALNICSGELVEARQLIELEFRRILEGISAN
jgi:hypothetical protein